MTEKFAAPKPVHLLISATVTTGYIWIRCQSLRTASLFQRHQQSGMRFHVIIAPSSNLLGLTYRLTHYPWPAVRPPIFQLKTMSVSTCILDMLKKTSQNHSRHTHRFSPNPSVEQYGNPATVICLPLLLFLNILGYIQ